MSDEGELLADRYRLRCRLGSGAMGVVWQATDELLQRPVAVKQLLPQPGLDAARVEEARQRAMREGRLAARLHHPNAVAVHDVTEHEGLPVLVMEYAPSRSLADVLAEQGTMTPEAVAGIGAQTASALEAAHAVGIVHRDVKPGNVLLGSDGTVKITDFGISHAADDVVVTRTGILAGTPAYLAPEIARGHSPTPSSDVFSLAATLYEAVEARTPFDHGSDNSLALLHVVAAGNALPPRRAGPLATVLTHMLKADPAQRPELAQAREAMRAVAVGTSLPTAVDHLAHEVPARPLDRTATAPPPGEGRNGTRLDARPLDQRPGPRGGHPGAKRRRLLLTAAAVAVAVLTGVLVAAQLGPGGDPAPQASPASRTLAPHQLERIASDYYALLPEHPDNAWRRLGPGLRSRGHARYADFWTSVSGVTVFSAPRATGERTVHVGVELTLRDGTRVRKLHRLGMTTTTGNPLINTDTVLRSERIAPPPPPSPTEHDERHEEGEEEQPGEEHKKEKREKKQDRRGGNERNKGEKDKKDKKGEKG
ncbi:hypothetical protein FHX42_004845 [Saccharopolyspora lacisalsi]|uniref:non-specific serine/threonine protein kinase n=1 Tax=Halosaccharopolyspora lacisalsi TaxID=1000566 RepID=A0A839E3L2_9PSEU|nr:serine/threonine-protein kinase [Halosaccharopolyspora lacisalsi]MBA8827449.1 hypothetical protein [Halosaccharopolyspora lacisalsi]